MLRLAGGRGGGGRKEVDIYLFVNILNIYYHQIIAELPNNQLRKIIYVHSRCKTHVQKSGHCRILLGPLQETKVKGRKHQVLHFLSLF